MSHCQRRRICCCHSRCRRVGQRKCLIDLAGHSQGSTRRHFPYWFYSYKNIFCWKFWCILCETMCYMSRSMWLLVGSYRFIACTTREFDWAWVCWGVICQCQQEHACIESGEFAWSCCITKLPVGGRKKRML